jgi:hypothetical protein
LKVDEIVAALAEHRNTQEHRDVGTPAQKRIDRYTGKVQGQTIPQLERLDDYKDKRQH